MKKLILKTILSWVSFLVFLTYSILLLISVLADLVCSSNGGYSYMYYPNEAFGIEINTLWYNLFQLLAVVVLTGIFGYILIKTTITLYKKVKENSTAKTEQRAAQKAARAEANKQARIEQLQAELDELKRD